MQNVLNGGSPFFSPSQMNPSVHGWNQSIDAGISNFLGPPMYAPSPAMMLPMMMTMLNQMMMMFMQGAAQSQSHFPFQEQTGLPQPYMNMP